MSTSASTPSEAPARITPEWGVHPSSQSTATRKPNQSGDIVSFTLELDDGSSSAFFEPSQAITGRTILVLARPMRVGSVKVHVQGIVSGGVAHTLLPNLRNNLPFTCHRHLFLDTITLYPSATAPITQPSSTLQAGKHTWPFSFRVPPVSILPPTYRGAMGSVRYEAVSTLERSLLDFDAVAKPSTLKLVSNKEFCVRSVETRIARRAFETPLFKTVEVPVGRMWKKSGKVDFAIRMPRSGFTFDEQIPFTVDIINHSTDTLHLSKICIEERVTVVYADRSTWGPIPCIRVPFPYAETISATDRATVRSFRLSLPPLEPQQVVPKDTRVGKSLIWGGLKSRSSTSLRREPELATGSRVVGLNASFNTQPLKVAHFITCTLQSASGATAFISAPSKARGAITIEIPIVLVTCKRDASLLYQNESLQALVEEVEREEEERQRRREGRSERRLSLDTLPIYESGGVEEADVIVLESQQGIQLPHVTLLPGLALEDLREHEHNSPRELNANQSESCETMELNEFGLPPGYDVYGFGGEDGHVAEDIDSIRIRHTADTDSAVNQDSPRTSLSTRNEERGHDSAIADLVSPLTFASTSSAQTENVCAPLSYEPPGENVIALTPFVDNNPPSFQSIVPNLNELHEFVPMRERNRAHRFLRNSNLSMRSLWSSSISPPITSTNQTVSRASSSSDIPSHRSFSNAFRRRRLSFGASRAASRAQSIANVNPGSSDLASDLTGDVSNTFPPHDLDPPIPSELRMHRDHGLDTHSPLVSGRSLAPHSHASRDRSHGDSANGTSARIRRDSVSTIVSAAVSCSPQDMIETAGRLTESPISYRSSFASRASFGQMVAQRSMTSSPTVAESRESGLARSNALGDHACTGPHSVGAAAMDVFPSTGRRRGSNLFSTLREASSRSSLRNLLLKRGARNEHNSRDGNMEPAVQEAAQALERTWLSDPSGTPGTEGRNDEGENVPTTSSPMFMGNRKWGASTLGRRGFPSIFGVRARNTTTLAMRAPAASLS
ncbi:Arrestin domain-containing protein 2 [Chytriomyces hyalinus]|nr:Arrestin domain-containing protein 2 [Chytriomyces hyalinus]